ncbi:hypothetical protein KSS87_008101 [Heliosperma pusillum]|nr:hypothetical protein KSS87_008101 [Heliosperma pusillum]
MEKAVQESNVRNKYGTFKKWKPISPRDDGYPIKDVKGTSLFDLSLVQISWGYRDFIDLYTMEETGLQNLEIYGHIFLMDDQGNEFALFYRDRDNAEKVPIDVRNSVFTITLEKFQLESPRVSPATFCLVFHLLAKDPDFVIASQVKFIDNTTTEVAYDQVCQFEFECLPTTVTVEYTIFQCAMLASVRFIIEKIGEEDAIDESDVEYADMKGTISASFKVRDGSCFKHVLSRNCYSRHEFGNMVELAVFGVPSYSSLLIQPNVNVYGEEFTSTDNLDFDPRDTLNLIPYEKEMLGEKVRLRMLVKWDHAIHYLPESYLCEWHDRTRRELIEDRNWEQGNQNSVKADRLVEKCRKRLRYINQKNFRPISIQSRLQALKNRRWFIPYRFNPLVEVFSVSFCLYDNSSTTLDLVGTINVNDVFGDLLLFSRVEKNPQLLTSFDPIPLKSVGRSIQGPNFYIEIELKDGGGHEICNGYVAYDFHTVVDWLNRRLCSTIKGKTGFVMVHHSIFDYAVEAKIRFILMSNSVDVVNGRVFGEISGRYGNFRYATHYEKQFYQSMLFGKGEDAPANIVDGKVPLSKSVVVVPLNGELIVAVHICVLIEDEYETLKYTFEATFGPGKREEPKILSNKIQGSNFTLSMFVE